MEALSPLLPFGGRRSLPLLPSSVQSGESPLAEEEEEKECFLRRPWKGKGFGGGGGGSDGFPSLGVKEGKQNAVAEEGGVAGENIFTRTNVGNMHDLFCVFSQVLLCLMLQGERASFFAGEL